MCNDLENSPESLETLRKQLRYLSTNAIVESASISISTPQSSSHPSSTSALPSPNSSNSGLGLVKSPLAFLRAAFPDLSIQTLLEAVDNASSQDGTLSMQSLIEDLLSCELLCSGSPSIDDEEKWDTVPAQKPNKKKGKRAAKPQKLVIGDVRHRQLMKSPSQGPITPSNHVDPWNRLSSLAEYISTLIPIESSKLLSSFHSPEYPTAFHALASQISAITVPQRLEEDIDSELILMIEFMSGGEDTEDIDAAWARKCVQVTKGKLEDAMDLYDISKEIKQQVPIVHLKPPDISRTKNPVSVSASSRPPPTPRSPAINSRSPTVKSPRAPQVNVSEWRVVEKRRPKSSQLLPEAFDEVEQNRAIEQNWRDRRVEALRKASQHWQRGQDGRQIAGYYAEEANRYLAESRAAAVEVARAMVVQNRCVSVTASSLKMLNGIIRAKNKANGYHQTNSVDLHGMTREQALALVQEALACQDGKVFKLLFITVFDGIVASKDEPLYFITGKGKHSTGNKSVLLPALQRALRAEGWSFKVLEAGLLVYGKV
jgi:DNA-nicking Smr family endonuclease